MDGLAFGLCGFIASAHSGAISIAPLVAVAC